MSRALVCGFRSATLRVLCAVAISLMGLLSVGCSGEFEPQVTIQPTVSESAGRYFDARDLLTKRPSLLGALATAEEPRLRKAEIVERSADRLVLQTEGTGNGSVDWVARFDADRVFELDLGAKVDRPCIIRFFWRRADEPFDLSRSRRWSIPLAGEHHSRRLLRGREGFEGEIVAVRIQVEAEEPIRLELDRLEGYGWDPSLELPAGTDQPLVALRFGDEVRPSFLLAGDSARIQAVPPGRWVLRGAAAHPWPKARRLRLELVGPQGTIDTRTVDVAPVASSVVGQAWTSIVWPVSVGEEGAELRYSLPSDPGVGDSDAVDTPVFVAALRPLREPVGPSPRAVLVSLDTLRKDVLGLYGASGDPSPAIDRLGQRSWVFDRAFATSSWTLPSHMSMLTGYWPARHAVEGGERSYLPSSPSLAQTLREAGYWTEAWVEGGFVDPRFGFAYGFDRYVVQNAYHRMSEIVSGGLGTLRGIEAPVFLFLHTFQPHAPYDPDLEAFARYAGTDDRLPNRVELWEWMEEWRHGRGRVPTDRLALLWSAYRAGIHKVDGQMKTLLEGLDDLPEASPEVLVVTSDHGEAFQERTEMLEHGRWLYPELLAVPLIVSTGGEHPPARVDELASIADIPATIAALLDVSYPFGDGRVLVPGASDPPDGVRAGVQPPYNAAYRIAHIGPDRIESLEIGDSVGDGRSYRVDPLPHIDASVPADADRAPADPVDRDRLESAWSYDHRGRTEIAIRFPKSVGGLPVRVRSSGEIVDAIVLPSVRAQLRTSGAGEVVADLTAEQETHWLTLLLELSPPDAGLVIEVPASAGELIRLCGDEVDPLDAEACHSAVEAAMDVEAGLAAAAAATLTRRQGGWLRIVRHPGAPFRSAPAEGRGDGSRVERGIDRNLAQRLQALGYVDVMATEDHEQDGRALDPSASPVSTNAIEIRRPSLR